MKKESILPNSLATPYRTIKKEPSIKEEFQKICNILKNNQDLQKQLIISKLENDEFLIKEILFFCQKQVSNLKLDFTQTSFDFYLTDIEYINNNYSLIKKDHWFRSKFIFFLRQKIKYEDLSDLIEISNSESSLVYMRVKFT